MKQDIVRDDTSPGGPIQNVLILGCGRSGTSIFGELFESLERYQYYCEPPFEELFQYDHSIPVAVKVPTECEGFPASPGLSFPMDQLQRAIPDPRHLFWIVRHPLDAICSLRVGIANDWGHHPKPPDWRDWQSRPLIEQCAHHWQYINDVGFKQVREMTTVVQFEDMLQDPQKFASNVARDIGIDSGEESSTIEQWAARVQNTNNERFVEAECSRNYSRPDHKVRIERWRENLSADEVSTILPILDQTPAQFGYDLSDSLRSLRRS
jgi:hypothetical protein